MIKAMELPPDWELNEFMGLNVANDRAAHQILDNPNIFEDPLALRIIGAEAESKLRLSLARRQEPAQRAFRASVMVRNRFAEDELAKAIQRGVCQYVILGAGLDTFAYRSPFPLLRVFEVDHPATQAWKRSCLEKAAIPIPASVTYVSVDFERQMMIDVLRQSGFKSDEPAFISFIGVVRYLSRETFISVLTSIVSSMRAGSEVVFDFDTDPHLLEVWSGRELPSRSEPVSDSSLLPSLVRRLRRLTHEMIANRTFEHNDFRPTRFDIESLTRDLQRIGFADMQLLGPKELNMRYCRDRIDGLRLRHQLHMVKARV